MKELIEQEILRRGYQIVKWFKFFDSWEIEATKNDQSIILDADQIMDELLTKEMRETSPTNWEWEWEYNSMAGLYSCPRCDHWEDSRTNYCSNCGKNMKRKF